MIRRRLITGGRPKPRAFSFWPNADISKSFCRANYPQWAGPKKDPDQRSNQSLSWTEAAGMWMPSGRMALLSMLTILGLILRRGSGLPRSRKRGFKNTQYLSNQNDHQARPVLGSPREIVTNELATKIIAMAQSSDVILLAVSVR